MLIVLSPSKTIDFKRSFPQHEKVALPLFLKDADILMEELRGFSVEEIMEKEKISLRLARATYEYFQSYLFSNTPQKPAVFAFTGNVYTKMRAGEMNRSQLDFLQTHLRIFSALYGILSPMDLIKPHRLNMESGLIGNLYDFWKEKVTAEIMKLLPENEHVLVNLASNEYIKLIDRKKLSSPVQVITPVFLHEKNGRQVNSSLYIKHGRGLMMRFIAENEIRNTEYLKAFDSEGYLFDPYLSKKEEWYFRKII